jgi:hypothetical protein
MKSFLPKDGSGEPPEGGRNGERDFHGEKRSNETHASTTVILTRDSIKRHRARQRSFAIWGMWSWKTAAAWW